MSNTIETISVRIPMSLSAPEGITWPKALQDLIDQHAAAHAEYVQIRDERAETLEHLRGAHAADDALLDEAIRNGKPDPGTPTFDKYSRQYVVDSKREEHAAIAVDAIRGRFYSAVPDYAEEVQRACLSRSLDQLDAWEQAVKEAQKAAVEASRAAATIESPTQWSRVVLNLSREHIGTPTSGSIGINAYDGIAIRQTLNRLVDELND